MDTRHGLMQTNLQLHFTCLCLAPRFSTHSVMQTNLHLQVRAAGAEAFLVFSDDVEWCRGQVVPMFHSTTATSTPWLPLLPSTLQCSAALTCSRFTQLFWPA